jgi:hypothetical protein
MIKQRLNRAAADFRELARWHPWYGSPFRLQQQRAILDACIAAWATAEIRRAARDDQELTLELRELLVTWEPTLKH